jgi:hypothetical protein
MSQGSILRNLTISDARAQMNDLEKKLAGPNGDDCLLRLKEFLRREDTLHSEMEVWRTIMIRPFDSKSDLALTLAHVSITARLLLIQPEFVLYTKEEQIDLVVKSVGDMGLGDTVYYSQILAWIEVNGALCQMEDAVHIRLQYSDQSIGHVLNVGMKVVVDRNGDRRIFTIENPHKLLLSTHHVSSEYPLSVDAQFVFRAPKKS